MGKDVKIGLALGLLVIVGVIVGFSVAGRGRSPEEAPPAAPGPGAPGGPGQVNVTIDPRPGLPVGPAPGAADRRIPAAHSAPPDRRDSAPVLLTARTVPPAGTVIHVVQGGDNLWDLARRYYRTTAAVSKIHEANRDKLPTPNSPLQIGMKLVIPDVPTAPAEHALAAGPDAGSSRPLVATATSGISVENAELYTVRSGDTLAIIAQRFYGDSRLIKPILDANPRLRGNPDRILPGWKLSIPRVAASRGTGPRRELD